MEEQQKIKDWIYMFKDEFKNTYDEYKKRHDEKDEPTPDYKHFLVYAFNVYTHKKINTIFDIYDVKKTSYDIIEDMLCILGKEFKITYPMNTLNKIINEYSRLN
jgi:hypothetical protein